MSKEKKRQTAEIINPGLGDIEKVRDILFGKYVASFEQRFAELEARLEGDVEQIKNRLTEKLKTMDAAVNKSLENLDQKILQETKSRDTDLVALQNTVKKAETTLQHSVSMMEDQANQELALVRASLEESHQELLDQTTSVQAELAKKLDMQKNNLEKDKVGRQALALMLDEVAIKLRGE